MATLQFGPIADPGELKDLGDVLISCNDVIYLLESPVEGLKALAAVLKPEGIIRTNLHNIYTRGGMLEMQEAFRLLGLQGMRRQEAANRVYEVMDHLKPENERTKLWNSKASRLDMSRVFNNFLLVGDKAFSIPDTFAFLREADLDMVCLVDFGSWDLRSVFKQMPAFVEQRLEQLSLVEQLHLYELLIPNTRRLIDFWAEHRGSSLSFPWGDEDWLNGIIHLNPVVINSLPFRQQVDRLLRGEVRSLMLGWEAAKEHRLIFDQPTMTWLSLLLEGPQPFTTLVDKRMATAELDRETVTEQMLGYLQALEEYLFVMLEPTA